MERATREEQTRLEIIRLCHGTLDVHMLQVELLERLQTVIAFDALFFSTTDPSTLFFTSAMHNEIPSWAVRPFLENEFLQDDFNHFRDLVKTRRSVGILSEQTQHELSRSQRYRDILAPLALGDEIRAVFSANAACWGLCACIGSGMLLSIQPPMQHSSLHLLRTSLKVCARHSF